MAKQNVYIVHNKDWPDILDKKVAIMVVSSLANIRFGRTLRPNVTAAKMQTITRITIYINIIVIVIYVLWIYDENISNGTVFDNVLPNLVHLAIATVLLTIPVAEGIEKTSSKVVLRII